MPTYHTPGAAGGGPDYRAINILDAQLSKEQNAPVIPQGMTYSQYLRAENERQNDIRKGRMPNSIYSYVSGGSSSSRGKKGKKGDAGGGDAPYGPGGGGAPQAPGQQYADITALMRQAQQQSNLGRIPNAAGLESQSSQMIQQQLGGTVPQDVLNMLSQGAAERGISTGMPGSPAANAAYLRALGLTSMEVQQQGQQNLTAAYGRNPGAPIPDASQQFITPIQQEQLRMEQARMIQQQKQFEQEMELRRQAQAIAASRGGSGYGGGGYAQAPQAAPQSPFVTYPNLPIISGSGSTPTVSPPTAVPWSSGWQGAPAGTPTPYAYGYVPTSSGSMYMGSQEGYGAAPTGTVYNPFTDTSDYYGG